MMLFRTLAMVLMLLTINSAVTFAAFKVGDQGKDVAEIQGKLVNLGYDVIADGAYGPATVEAVKSFQSSKGIKADGVVSSATYAALVGKDMPNTAPESSYINTQLLDIAQQYLGVPYVFGGNSPSYGLDCSAYVQFVFKQVGVNLPRTADYQFEVGTPVSRSELIPGDAVFFTTYTYGASHVGIYLGDDKFIHASSGRGCVTISSLNSQYYSTHYIGARRMM